MTSTSLFNHYTKTARELGLPHDFDAQDKPIDEFFPHWFRIACNVEFASTSDLVKRRVRSGIKHLVTSQESRAALLTVYVLGGVSAARKFVLSVAESDQ